MNNENPTWELSDGTVIVLLTVEQLRALPKETLICSINGNRRSVEMPGEDPPDEDTRYGYTAWGVDPQQHR